ncbi:MAG: flavin reductase family protein [Corynebacterium sp.]|nr:flavin reductase family protein [Corynebacterium sp.]
MTRRSLATTAMPFHPDPDSANRLRKQFSRAPAAVTLVAGLVDDQPDGFVVATFVGLSLDPPLVSISIQRSSRTWQRLRELPAIGLTILSTDHALYTRQLAAREGDRFANVDWFSTEHGAVGLENGTSFYSCKLEEEVAAGDHVLGIFRVLGTANDKEASPLIFADSSFQRLGGDVEF